MSQTSYANTLVKAFAGLLADANMLDAVSKIVSGSTLKFGYGAKLLGDDQIEVLATNADKFAGVIVHKHVEDGILLDKAVVSVIKKGRIWVKVDEAVVSGDVAQVRVAGGEVGVFRTSVDGVNTIAINAKFASSANIGELAILDLNLA